MAGKSPAGRFVPARTFDEDHGRAGLERLRAAHGPGLRPVRQRQDRAQVLAEPLQPVAHHRHRRQLQPAAVPDRDAAVGRQEPQRRRRGLAALRLHEPRLRNQLRQPAGQLRHRRAERYGEYPRTWNLEQGVEVSHELLDGLSVGGSWWKGSFHNLTNTVNQSWSTADYSPYTWYNPTTGQPFTVYARSAAATGAPDPQPRHLRSRSARTPTTRTASTPSGAFRAAARSAAASPVERERSTSCTAPDDPNYVTATAGVFNGVALCDDFALDIPWRPQFKMSGTKEIG